MSPGLKRAREPYLIKNALTGLALGALAVGVWAYSISAVKQDVFDDVDEEARQLARSGASAGMLSLEDEKKQMEAAAAASAASSSSGVAGGSAAPVAASASPSSPVKSGTSPSRGILQALDKPFPRLLDPQRKTLVWGAPPVDNIGRISGS